MLFVVRTKTKWERSLQQSNLKTKAACEHHEFLGKLIQEGAEKLQTIETLRKGPSGNTLQATYEYLKMPICKTPHIHFHGGLGTRAVTERVPFLSQIAGWTPPNRCIPTTGSFGRPWQRLVSAEAQQARSRGFGDAALSLSRAVLDRFL